MGETQKKTQNKKTAKKKKNTSKNSKGMIILGLAVIFVIAVAIWIVIDAIYANKYADKNNEAVSTENTTEASTQASVDYSKGLTEDGYIEGVKALDYITLPDIDNITVKKDDIEPSDKDIASALDDYMVEELDKDSSRQIQDGDKVNIDYVGYVDGETFSGGDTKGQGAKLTIGSNQYIDDFEEQLIGHKPGEDVEVNVTFPENYGNDELNGKDALFKVTINGIYNESEPTDEYVAENYSDIASTYAELKDYVVNNLRESKLEDAVWNSLQSGLNIDKYPEDYMNAALEVTRYMYENEYNYYNNYAYSLNGKYEWDSVYDYYGKSEEEYNKMIEDDAESQCRYYLLAQGICEKYGLGVTDDDVSKCLVKRGYTADKLEQLISTYGKGYIYQSALGDVAKAYVAGKAKVE